MFKQSLKTNISSLQVMKTLQILLKDNFTMKDLIKKLNENEKIPVFNNSVVSKYINTCRYCGVIIPKIHNKYVVTKLSFGLDLSIDELDLLENIQSIVKETMSSKSNKTFNKFLDKLNKFSNKRLAKVGKDSYFLTSELFEKAITDKRKIKLLLKNREEMVCIPLKMIEHKDKMYFDVIHDNKEKMVSSGRVAGITETNLKYWENYSETCVVFELKGDLAKRYSARENEWVSLRDGILTVSNKGEAKDFLFARLLRYDKDCEIKSPKSYRDEFKQILDNALQNYGE